VCGGLIGRRKSPDWPSERRIWWWRGENGEGKEIGGVCGPIIDPRSIIGQIRIIGGSLNSNFFEFKLNGSILGFQEILTYAHAYSYAYA